ncbi:MAG: PorT family protein [Cyclobacteriaceae bacterium]|nr:PorT family protein [Cyclobacteriaceae bacterium]
MKIVIAVVFILLNITNYSARGQDNPQSFLHRLSITPRAGFSFSKLLNAQTPSRCDECTFEQKSLKDVNYDIVLEVNVAIRWSVISGYSTVTKGTEAEYELLVVNETYFENKKTIVTVKNSYNVLPLWVRYRYTVDKFDFFADAGFYYAFLKNSQLNFRYTDFSGYWGSFDRTANAGYDSETNMYSTNASDYGWMVGLGLEFVITPALGIQFNPQVSVGLQKLDRVNSNRVIRSPNDLRDLWVEDYFGVSSNSRNVVFSLNFGLRYKF